MPADYLAEIRNVVDDVKRNNEAYFDEEINAEIYAEKEEQPAGSDKNDDKGTEDDVSLKKAVFACLAANCASISMLQRKLGYGYPRASRVFDRMESMNLIGPFDPSSKVRTVLINRSEAIDMFGEPDEDLY